MKTCPSWSDGRPLHVQTGMALQVVGVYVILAEVWKTASIQYMYAYRNLREHCPFLLQRSDYVKEKEK